MAQFIPFHLPSIGEEEITAVTNVLRSGWLTTGPVAHSFEKEFAEYIGCKHALAVNSGTAAMQLALEAVGVRSGDEVIVPTNTFTATAEVVTYFGATPVLCDNLPDGFNMDPTDAERKISPRTKAIVPVHIGGEPCDMAAIGALAARHRLPVIEDAAHALPAAFEGRRVGTMSDFTAFSFYATKTITTGEGGMLTTDNDAYAKRASMMRLHGIGNDDAWKRYSRAGSWAYQVLEAGYKFNMPDVLAALGVAQLRKCETFLRQRRLVAELYLSKLAEIEELELPPVGGANCEHSWHLFIIRLKKDCLKIDRDLFIEELKAVGVGASVHFIPLHRHPFYQKRYGYQADSFPNAENAFSRCISLPIYPDLKESQVEHVVQAVQNIVCKYRKNAPVSLPSTRC
ncbi:MAG: DegT/DnrJ/EryC1/StrS family aminotransferase [Acidobacteriaceae bacterium]|nr:DegT/DnrJ/EryC1/StrS family aminotransferase [Acidobacteriaceae bacterium]